MGRPFLARCSIARGSAGCAAAAFLFATLAASPSPAQTAAQGVSPREVVVGTHLDLSGPLAAWGQSVRNGLEMAIGEVNSNGGVNGRRIHLIVKDDGYDPERAAAAARELATEDHVFAILSPLGTPTAQAAMREALSRGVLYLFPLTTNEEAYLPTEPLKFGITPSHALSIQAGLRRILNARGPLRVGVLASADEFGRAVRQGAENELQRRGLVLAAAEDFDRGAEDGLSDALARLRQEHAEIVVLGTDAQETVQVLQAAAALRWHPIFLCSSACYLPEVATLGGAAVEGLYAVGQMPMPYPNDSRLRGWLQRYEIAYSKAATLQALTAYRNARLFLSVLLQAGQNPTPAGFARILETRDAWTDPTLGGLPIEFMPNDHLGSHSSLLLQIRGGRWVVLADNLPPRP